MNEMHYGLREINEMDYDLKEIKMTREELRSSDYVNNLSFLPDKNAMIFLLWKVLRAKIKVYMFFLISNSIFYLSLRLLREDLNFRLKVTKTLLTG